jgi:hypothetical protein
MMTRAHNSASVNRDGADADVVAAAGGHNDDVLVWHTSGQQGLMLESSGWEGPSLGAGVEEGVMAAVMDGEEGVGGGLGPGDVLVQGQMEGQGVLVVRRIEGQGMQLIRFVWQGGYGALGVELCGEWTGSEDTKSDGRSISTQSISSNTCTVVLAFAVDIPPPLSASPPSSSMAAVRFACGYDDGNQSGLSCVTRDLSHVMKAPLPCTN